MTPAVRRDQAALLVLALVVVLVGCAGNAIRVESEALPGAAFPAYASYCWQRAALPAREPPRPEAILDWRVRSAVDSGLAAKGYRKMPGKPCDFLVDYGVRFSDKQVDSFSQYADYRAKGGERGMQEVLAGYEEGMLTLRVIDAASGELAWHAAASAVTDPGRQAERVPEAVGRMLESFPPRGAP